MGGLTKWGDLTPKEIEGFTLNGKINVEHFLLDGTNNKNKLNGFYDKKLVDSMIKKIKNKEVSYYGKTDKELYTLLERINIEGKSVGILGSTQPWYESIVLSYGGVPITIEYSSLQTNDERLTLLTVDEYSKNPQKFDVVFSISSFEHDGLGRYGDPINPTGDIEAMINVKSMLKKDGILFLAVPVGVDTIFWNAHRIYGKHRFPKLIDGWEIIDKVSFHEKKFKVNNKMDQPVIVLKIKR
jgi:SAM-dependent methyltransferase|tara:strand:- start:1231 stop:1953 length:723 start_codon:yes stop_codon:yes gene_type:complete